MYKCVCGCEIIDTHIYIYIYVYAERKRERGNRISIGIGDYIHVFQVFRKFISGACMTIQLLCVVIVFL